MPKKNDKDKTFLYQLTLESYSFAVSIITVYELLRGDNTNEDLYWKAMFGNMTILPFDFNCAEQAARIYKDLKQKGRLIETEDLLIGATALEHNLRLATGNVRHFGLVLLRDTKQ
jgi:predicted nucleic acid-binding protein